MRRTVRVTLTDGQPVIEIAIDDKITMDSFALMLAQNNALIFPRAFIPLRSIHHVVIAEYDDQGKPQLATVHPLKPPDGAA